MSTYDGSGSCGTNATWTVNGDAKTLTISGTGPMNNYGGATSVPWYSRRDAIETVVIDFGITSIGDYAFSGCNSTVSVSVPDTVTYIGNYAFNNCTALEHTNIPEGVTYIGNHAYMQCNKLALSVLDIPQGVTAINPYTFAQCKLINYVNIPNNVTSIGDSAFNGCSNLIVILFKGDEPTMGNYAFSLGAYQANVTATICSTGWASAEVFTPDIIGNYTTFGYDKWYAPADASNNTRWMDSMTYVKVDGEWRDVVSISTKVNGVWKESKPYPIYTIIYDKTKPNSTSDCLTYAGNCTGFTPMKGGSGNVNEGSWAVGNGTIFDAIDIGVFINGQWLSDAKHSMGAIVGYNAFTRIPRIYEKVTDLGNYKVQLDISLGPFKGSRLHPAFIVDGVKKNHRYIGRHLGANDTTLKSQPGLVPTTSRTRAQFRTAAANNGPGYNLTNYWDWDLVNKLYLFAFKDFDSQTALGSGLTAGDLIATGELSSQHKSWMHGGGAGRNMSFLGIEDYYGNAWWFIDDFYCDGGTCYAGNSNTPTDDVNNKTVIATGMNAPGVVSTCKGTIDAFFLMETGGGSATTGLCDYQYYDNDANGGRVGGYYASGTETGMFYINAMNSVSATSEMVGARLAYSD